MSTNFYQKIYSYWNTTNFEVKRYQAQMKIFGFPFFLRGGGLVWGRRGRLMRTIKAKRGVLISGARGMNGTNDISDTILVTEIK